MKGDPLTVAYYRRTDLATWVDRTIVEEGIRRALVFSSGMAPYLLEARYSDLRRVIDFVDVDSDKWAQYAGTTSRVTRWIYRREAVRLLALERRIAAEFDGSVFLSAAEAALFRKLAPESADKVSFAYNGVDTVYFDPQLPLPTPYAEGECPLVFTGAMDYWPNVDAVCWFAEHILPSVRRAAPDAVFYAVGPRPAPAVRMTREEAIEALGTIAHSGTKEFLAALKKKNLEYTPDLIGQFGVGFYSSFMIADKVTLLSRKAAAKDNTGITWESTADGSFLVEDAAKDTPGTDVILHIKEDEKKYLDEWQIRDVVSKYSDYNEYPIVMDVVREEDSALVKGKKVKAQKEEQINSGKALWLRDRTDISENEYNEFYKHISHDFSDPMKVIHYHAEGTSEFTCLLYLPAHAPLDIFYKEFRIGPALYVKKVQIMDHCEELIPPYLRFIKGIVDSSDLPLNVSRETLSEQPPSDGHEKQYNEESARCPC